YLYILAKVIAIMMNYFKDIVEKSVFGVCQFLGDKIGIKTSRVRLYFIYLSFVTMGSPVIIYLFLAFWLNLKKYLRKSLNPLLD
ncbi:PspC domain-containing protein, partial [uncultured Muriicola sp.]|uniref:PspC domain-containing protein n=1 Tax=uncultured Muriicola sp. TaxID=1583102 RepID=UPI0026342E28